MNGRVLAVAAAAFGVFCVLSVAAEFSAGATLDSNSGVWLSLAIDLSKGTFYRPLVGEAGLGGTRYFPLTFVLHAGLIRTGLSPIAAGHVLEVAAGASTILAARQLLRELEVPRPLARSLALLTLCSASAMHALTTIRGDLVPVALNMWGAVFAFRAFHRDSGADLHRASAFFAAAAVAKITALYAVIGIAGAFAFSGRVRRGAQLAGATLLGTVVLLWLANWASDGRMMESMRACMFAGTGGASARRAPLGAAYTMVRQDPLSILWLTLIGASALTLPRERWREPIVCLTLSALAMIVVLFSSPGIDFNHLIDVYVVATIAAGYLMVRAPQFRPMVASSIAAAVLLSIVAFYVDFRHALQDPLTTQLPSARALLSEPGTVNAPIFADTGIVPALVGETNYLVDPFMFGQLRGSDARFDAAFIKAFDEKRFAVVVIPTDNPERMNHLYGPRFVPSLKAGYELAGDFSPYFIYRRKP